MLMKVLPHRHHPSAEIQNQESLTYHKLGGGPELFFLTEYSISEAARKLDAVPSTPPASIADAPLAVPVLLFRRLLCQLNEGTEATVTLQSLIVDETQKRRSPASTDRI